MYIAEIGVIVTARCCRDWPVVLNTKIGRCGQCGERPVPVGEWEDRRVAHK